MNQDYELINFVEDVPKNNSDFGVHMKSDDSPIKICEVLDTYAIEITKFYAK